MAGFCTFCRHFIHQSGHMDMAFQRQLGITQDVICLLEGLQIIAFLDILGFEQRGGHNGGKVIVILRILLGSPGPQVLDILPQGGGGRFLHPHHTGSLVIAVPGGDGDHSQAGFQGGDLAILIHGDNGIIAAAPYQCGIVSVGRDSRSGHGMLSAGLQLQAAAGFFQVDAGDIHSGIHHRRVLFIQVIIDGLDLRVGQRPVIDQQLAQSTLPLQVLLAGAQVNNVAVIAGDASLGGSGGKGRAIHLGIISHRAAVPADHSGGKAGNRGRTGHGEAGIVADTGTKPCGDSVGVHAHIEAAPASGLIHGKQSISLSIVVQVGGIDGLLGLGIGNDSSTGQAVKAAGSHLHLQYIVAIEADACLLADRVGHQSGSALLGDGADRAGLGDPVGDGAITVGNAGAAVQPQHQAIQGEFFGRFIVGIIEILVNLLQLRIGQSLVEDNDLADGALPGSILTVAQLSLAAVNIMGRVRIAAGTGLRIGNGGAVDDQLIQLGAVLPQDSGGSAGVGATAVQNAPVLGHAGTETAGAAIGKGAQIHTAPTAGFTEVNNGAVMVVVDAGGSGHLGNGIGHDGQAGQVIEGLLARIKGQLVGAIEVHADHIAGAILHQHRLGACGGLGGSHIGCLVYPGRNLAVCIGGQALLGGEPQNGAAVREDSLGLLGDRYGGRYALTAGQSAGGLKGTGCQVTVGVDALPLDSRLCLCAAGIGDLHGLGQLGGCARFAGDRGASYGSDGIGIALSHPALGRDDLLIGQSPVIDQDLADGAAEIAILTLADMAGRAGILGDGGNRRAGICLAAVYKYGIGIAIFADSGGIEQFANGGGTDIGTAPVAVRAAAEAPDHFVLAGGEINAAPIPHFGEPHNAILLAATGTGTGNGRAVAAGSLIRGGIHKHGILAVFLVPETAGQGQAQAVIAVKADTRTAAGRVLYHSGAAAIDRRGNAAHLGCPCADRGALGGHALRGIHPQHQAILGDAGGDRYHRHLCLDVILQYRHIAQYLEAARGGVAGLRDLLPADGQAIGGAAGCNSYRTGQLGSHTGFRGNRDGFNIQLSVKAARGHEGEAVQIGKGGAGDALCLNVERMASGCNGAGDLRGYSLVIGGSTHRHGGDPVGFRSLIQIDMQITAFVQSLNGQVHNGFAAVKGHLVGHPIPMAQAVYLLIQAAVAGRGHIEAVAFVIEQIKMLRLHCLGGGAGTVIIIHVVCQFAGTVSLDGYIAPVQHFRPGGLHVALGAAQAGPHGVDEHGDPIFQAPGFQLLMDLGIRIIVADADLYHDQIVAAVQMGLQGTVIGVADDIDIKDAVFHRLGGDGILRVILVPVGSRGGIPGIHSASAVGVLEEHVAQHTLFPEYFIAGNKQILTEAVIQIDHGVGADGLHQIQRIVQPGQRDALTGNGFAAVGNIVGQAVQQGRAALRYGIGHIAAALSGFHLKLF